MAMIPRFGRQHSSGGAPLIICKQPGEEMMTNIEQDRLREAHEDSQPWYRWGPYLSERQWATVREDYSADGNAWAFFPHDHARSRTDRKSTRLKLQSPD